MYIGQRNFAVGRRMHGLREEFICVSLRKFPFELPSTCKGIASRELIGSQNPDDYTVDMGTGLFSLLDFYERDVIAVFKGDVIDESKYQDLKRLGKATYVAEVVKCMYLNC